VKYAFIERHRDQFRVAAMCRVLNASRSGYYDWEARTPSRRDLENAGLLAHIRAVHSEHREAYGALKTWRTLKSRGIACGKHRVARLRRDAGVVTLRTRRFRRMGAQRASMAAPNLLARQFTSPAPNRTWVGDMTSIRTVVGWLHLAIVLDLFSRKVVGWAMGESIDEKLALAALNMAIVQRQPKSGLIHHTDQGTPYTAGGYRARLQEAGILASHSSVGACYDNAAAETFFSTLKNEMTHHYRFASREQARAAIFDFIELFYNRKRMHQYLNYRTPEAIECAAHSTCP
jgi:transposase InsO family protein